MQVDRYGGAVGVDGKGASGAFRGHDFPGQHRVERGASDVRRLLFGPAQLTVDGGHDVDQIAEVPPEPVDLSDLDDQRVGGPQVVQAADPLRPVGLGAGGGVRIDLQAKAPKAV